MKLIVAIVQDEDTGALTEALISAGHRFTKVSTTGSFLRTGNTSLLIGVEDQAVPAVMGIPGCFTCRRTSRSKSAAPSSSSSMSPASNACSVSVITHRRGSQNEHRHPEDTPS